MYSILNYIKSLCSLPLSFVMSFDIKIKRTNQSKLNKCVVQDIVISISKFKVHLQCNTNHLMLVNNPCYYPMSQQLKKFDVLSKSYSETSQT